MNKIFEQERGSEQLYAFVGFSIIALIFFLAFSFGMPYLKYISIAGYSQELVNYDYSNDKPNPTGVRQIQDKLMHRIRSKKLPMDPKSVKVDYDYTQYKIKFEYDHDVNLFLVKVPLHFKVDKITDRTR